MLRQAQMPDGLRSKQFAVSGSILKFGVENTHRLFEGKIVANKK